MRAAGALLAGAALLSGCASLPTSGPTAGQIVKGTTPDRNPIGMRIVDINQTEVAQNALSNASADAKVATLAALASVGSNDVVGPGDILAISVYEAGVGLFGSDRAVTGAFDPSAHGENFPIVPVNRDGTIKLPFVGSLEVAGRSPGDIQAMIERAYQGKSQTPQALVAVKENLSETVYVSGDVRKPGRIELSLQNERLLDAVATAGGPVTRTQDMIVRFSRHGRLVEERLDRIHAGAPDDLVLIAGDRIELIGEPQTFTVFGAAGKVAQVPFDQTDVSLAEAVARAGGPRDDTANPRSVFLFRYDPPAMPGAAPQPTIYRLNMMDPAQYFLAQRFAMRDKDVLYVSTASINRAAKFVSIINQLFSPVYAIRAVAN